MDMDIIFKEHKKAIDTVQNQADRILTLANIIRTSWKNKGTVFLMGNGGSAADSQHIAAELIGRFDRERNALPAIALTTDSSILTAISNDYAFDVIFSRQIEGLAKKGDVVIGISTSGNSKNILLGIEKANELGCTTIGLCGSPGKLAEITEMSICIEGFKTPRVQEAHALVGHILCQLLD